MDSPKSKVKQVFVDTRQPAAQFWEAKQCCYPSYGCNNPISLQFYHQHHSLLKLCQEKPRLYNIPPFLLVAHCLTWQDVWELT